MKILIIKPYQHRGQNWPIGKVVEVQNLFGKKLIQAGFGEIAKSKTENDGAKKTTSKGSKKAATKKTTTKKGKK